MKVMNSFTSACQLIIRFAIITPLLTTSQLINWHALAHINHEL